MDGYGLSFAHGIGVCYRNIALSFDQIEAGIVHVIMRAIDDTDAWNLEAFRRSVFQIRQKCLRFRRQFPHLDTILTTY